MIRRTARWLLVLALSFSIGLQWALLQSVAWVGMVISYSHEATLARGLAMTFDGVHPCCLCRTVEKGGTAQTKQEIRFMVTKIELASQEAGAFTCEPPVARLATWTKAAHHDAPRLAPATPPPERIG